MKERQGIVNKEAAVSISLQCKLLSLHRSGLYYRAQCEGAENLNLMRLMDEHFLKYPFKGVRKMTVWLKGEGYWVNRKRVGRLYKLSHEPQHRMKYKTKIWNKPRYAVYIVL